MRAFVGNFQLCDLFAGMTYVQNIERIATPEGTLLNESRFNDDERFAGREFALNFAQDKSTKKAWEAATAHPF